MKFGFEVEIVPTSFIMILLIAAMGVPALIQPISAASDDFTIIALPDTQVYSQSSLGEEIYTAQTQWIVDNKVGFNIVFVVHEGDIVETWNSDIQWTRVSASMALLDDNVPYSVVPGNHDHEDATTTGSTSYYNTYFPTSRFNTESWWGGNFHDNDNNYQLMTIGSDDYIFLSLDYCADNDEIAWANSVLDTYSDRKAILTTHGYLDSSGNRDSCGNNIWTNLVYDHSNLQIVLCGHALGEALRTDSNQEGKSVYQMLADYQGRTNGGNGWLRILTFKPSEDKIYVQTYSPYLDEYETDTNSQFTLDYDMTSDGTQSCSDTITRTETQTFIETRTETVTGSGSSGDAWACDACQYRMKLTFQNSASSQSLVNFPVLIKLDSSRIDYSKTSVTDIRFYDGTTLLSKETELWNAAGDSFIWVKVPQIDNVDTDYIYAYYGCSDTNNDDAENVWDSNYMMVHHLEETSDIHYDSTSNNNDGTPGWTPEGVVSEQIPDMNAVGIVDGADDFDGIDDTVGVIHDNSLNFGTGDFTISVWVKYTSCGDTDIIRKGNTQSAPEANYKMEVSNNVITATLQGTNPGGGGSITTSTNYGDDNWHNAIFLRQSGIIRLYVDGVLKTSKSSSGMDLTNTANMGVGSKDDGWDDFFHGSIDEVRISNVARSLDWIVASYYSTKDQFVIYGGEEQKSGATITGTETVTETVTVTDTVTYILTDYVTTTNYVTLTDVITSMGYVTTTNYVTSTDVTTSTTETMTNCATETVYAAAQMLSGDVYLSVGATSGVLRGKPAGTSVAAWIDSTAGGALLGMAENGIFFWDTDVNYIDQTTGAPTGVPPGATLVTSGGPIVNGPVKYYELNRVAEGTPAYFAYEGGLYKFKRTTDNVVVATLTPTSTNDLFIIQIFTDSEGRDVIIIYGLAGRGTLAGALYFVDNADFFNGKTGYWIYEWIDKGTSGTIEHPDSPGTDTYTLVASG